MVEIKFKINDEDYFDNNKKALRILTADNMALLLWEIKHNMWREWKHNEDKLTLDNLREKLADLFDGYEVSIDNLID